MSIFASFFTFVYLARMFRAPYLRALRGLTAVPSSRFVGNSSGRFMRKLSTYHTRTSNLWKEDKNYTFLATVAVGSIGINFASCEKTKASENDSDEIDKISDSDSTIPSEKQLYEELPDEDEPTTCTICLINRQGPCRPHWRKFERCMKDNSPNEKDGEEKEAESPSMSEKCDHFMLPWIRCIQKYRNKYVIQLRTHSCTHNLIHLTHVFTHSTFLTFRYTLISNDFFQKEMIEEIEKSIEKDEMVLLDSIDLSSIVQVGSSWKKEHVDNNVKTAQGSSELPVFLAKDNDSQENTPDDILVEAVARINMWDRNSDRHIEIAYVKDQDGTLLGYDQFSDFKKSVKEMRKNDVKETEKKKLTDKVGTCNFHVNPNTTKSIQIFALYRDKEEVPVEKTNNEHINEKEGDDEKKRRTLFYSPLISMNDVPIQTELTQDTTNENKKTKADETEVKPKTI